MLICASQQVKNSTALPTETLLLIDKWEGISQFTDYPCLEILKQICQKTTEQVGECRLITYTLSRGMMESQRVAASCLGIPHCLCQALSK